MKTYLDCIPCFFKQALESARIAGADEKTQKEILDKICRLVLKFPLDSCPAEIGRSINGIIREKTGKPDPYLEIKRKSNCFALGLYPRLKNKTAHSNDKLLAGVILSIVGNVIDYGVKNSLNVKEEVERSIKQDFDGKKNFSSTIFDYPEFKKSLAMAKTVLYLADNAGEVVFDRVLIEEIKNRFLKNDKKIIYAVRGKPAINDALVEDAEFCGIGGLAEIIPSGSDAPGTVLKFCSEEFIKIYKKADLIISKGQGNFEALSGEKNKSIFFLFKVKCPVIARDVGCKIGSIVLKRNKAA